MSNPEPRHVLAKRIVGILLTCWPLPASIWFSAHMSGWKFALILYGILIAIVAGFMFGLKLLRDSEGGTHD